MRLLLLNINYLRHYFLSKPCRKILWILNTLPNGVIHHNMPLSTTNILIVSVSIPYQSRIVSVSFSYCSPIVLLLGSGNNTETIRNRTEDERMRNGGTRVVNLTIIVNSYDNGKTQTNYCGCQHVIYRRRQNPTDSCRTCLGFGTLYLTG